MKIIPFGDRILVKRQKIGETIGKENIILAPMSVEDRKTDIAEVIYVPDHTEADKKFMDNEEILVDRLLHEAKEGNPEAFKQVINLNAYLKLKKIRKGMKVFISRYVGTDFYDEKNDETLTLVKLPDVLAIIED